MFEISKTNIKFKQIPESEDCESLISQGDKAEYFEAVPRNILWKIVKSVLFLVAFASTLLLGAWLGSHHFGDEDKHCISRVSQFSPLLGDIDISYSAVRFNGSLMRENIFRQSGSPEVDEAWQSLGVDYRSAIVPSSLAHRSGLTQSQVQVSSKYGGGFPANVEGLHHLHCLNLLRQSLYFNFDYYHSLGEGAFINSDEILRFHVTHCLDILRQQLMCTVDIGVLGQVWWNRNEPLALPDFNTRHKCRNFDAVRQWAFEHQAPEEVPGDYLKQPRMEDVF